MSAVWYCTPLFAAGILDTGGKFATGISITPAVPRQNLPPVSLIQVANLPQVSLIPVVYLDLWTSPQLFEKIWNDPNVIFQGSGEDNSWKNLKQKISWHCPFNTIAGSGFQLASSLIYLSNKRGCLLCTLPLMETSRKSISASFELEIGRYYSRITYLVGSICRSFSILMFWFLALCFYIDRIF